MVSTMVDYSQCFPEVSVEGHFAQASDGLFVPRQALVNYEAALKKQTEAARRQQVEAKERELSELSKDEYGEDIVAHMLEMEVCHQGSSIWNLTNSVAQNTARYCLHRYPDRDPMVHASLSP